MKNNLNKNIYLRPGKSWKLFNFKCQFSFQQIFQSRWVFFVTFLSVKSLSQRQLVPFCALKPRFQPKHFLAIFRPESTESPQLRTFSWDDENLIKHRRVGKYHNSVDQREPCGFNNNRWLHLLSVFHVDEHLPRWSQKITSNSSVVVYFCTKSDSPPNKNLRLF